MVTFLSLDHVTHYYFSKQGMTKALADITLSIDEGEFVSILGPSGCGKSTILSIVAGIIEQTKGDVLINDQPIDQANLQIGYMLQQDYLFPWKTIINNILIGPKVSGTLSKETKETGLELLKEVGIPNVANDYPDSLSGGMRQRVAFVRTFLDNPQILLLDEPFSALDYLTKLKLEDLVFSLLKKYRKTAILVTHDISEAIAMSDRIFVMEANPGTIAKTFEVPEQLRQERPFFVRRQPAYQQLFDEIWHQLNKHEQTFIDVKAVNENEG